jgi:hypothetical protein
MERTYKNPSPAVKALQSNTAVRKLRYSQLLYSWRAP